MDMVRTVLLVAALVCLLLAAIDVQARVKPGWLGLALWVLALLLPGAAVK